MAQTRRVFLKSTFAFSALSMLPFRFPLESALADAADPSSPIQRVPAGAFSSREFSGDDIERTHEILWNVDGYMRRRGGYPAPTEEAPVVVIGGGVAGLYATHLLSDLKPVLLEQERAFGGNSKGEQLDDSRYSIGAAYVVTPREGSPNAKLFSELGLWKTGRREEGGDMGVLLKDRFVKGFWQGATDPASRAEFARVHRELEKINARIGDLGEGEIRGLDSVTFAQWMAKTWGRVHPHVAEYLQLYAWSSFAASLDELSAYQMLGFIAAETGGLTAFPGGNAAIAEAFHSRLRARLGPRRLRSGCLAVDLRPDAEGVTVTYVGPDGAPRAIRARAAVFAAPKFVARRVIRGLAPEQERAMSQIAYRGYLVGNVFIDRPFEAPTFDMYCLEGEVPPSPSAMRPSPRAFSDICFGSWAQNNRVRHPVLTIYKTFAFDGDRQFLFNPAAHDKHRKRFLDGLEPFLAGAGLTRANVRGVRMTRWGHSLPVARAGLIASGTAERASAPVAGRIFFANQDNAASPAFETAADAAREAARAVRSALLPNESSGRRPNRR